MFQKLRKIIKYYIYTYRSDKERKNMKKANFEYGLNDKQRDIPKIIVSLTSFPARFDDIDLCLKSITLQSYKPDRIIVWLGSDSSDELIEKKLKKYERYGIEFIKDKENNYMSHKKYIYAFRNFEDSIIITLDDDLIYQKDVIESLVNMYIKNPKCIIARRVHKITWNNNSINPYDDWIYESTSIIEPSHFLFATTGAGTLFPPNILPKSCCDFKQIEKYAISADDVWLNFMALKNRIKVVWAKNKKQLPATTTKEQKISLSSSNVGNQKNDLYIKKIMKDFKITKEDYFSK